MTSEERFVVFECLKHRLVGVLHLPSNPLPVGLVLIGRAGGDRCSVHFGRAGAARGIAVFRFDLRGRGDCEGPLIPVEESGEDLNAAIGAFLEEATGIRRVVIWGLSEGGAGALLYACGDRRVTGLILANPWIRMDKAVAKEHIRQNLSRVLDRRFWDRIRQSEDGFRGAARSFIAMTRNWIQASGTRPTTQEASLKDKLMRALGIFPGPIQIILSGGDPATAIFQEVARGELEKLNREGRLTVRTEPEANHVFSRSDWRGQMIEWSLDWMEKVV